MAKLWAHPADAPLLGRPGVGANDFDSEGDYFPGVDASLPVCALLPERHT